MAQVVRVIDEAIVSGDASYTTQVCARANAEGMWEGWPEFIATDGSEVRRTARETTQPDFQALVHWANGLSPTYLEGALARTFEQLKVVRSAMPRPFFNAPATSPVSEMRVTVDRAVLDPFSVAAKGERLLRGELSALHDWHLRNIVRAYDLAPADINLERMSQPELVELIVAAVQPA